ncbi:hypothetical protein [Actinoplanes derwentensis]|uniref:YtxH-like protein n=1 Tax=Actinoplanes derwentensis TaxID=113562 RepID=A0A1H1RU99_9ACTN|nr:hypothetical protein [Actinoplanes derwentensis]GID84523.1 hypothetical protein Ade03nite_34470 [Actinoplanes derwentensis]SDS39283.1 hypothetical protein SAMN04489716_0687 [Actinoplanes derwentensis]
MGILKLAAGVAVGYVLGSRAGREKYESIAASARKAAAHPRFVEAQEKAKALIGTGTDKVNAKLHSAAESTRPTPAPYSATTTPPTPAPTPRAEVTKPLAPATTSSRTRTTTPTTEFGASTDRPL